MKWLRWLHRYLGAALAAFMFLLAVTGGVLIFKDEIRRLRYPSLAAAIPVATPADHAAAFSAIGAAFGDRIRMIRTPREGMAAYHVFLGGSEALIEPGSFTVIDEWPWYRSFTGILAEIHFHLAAGDVGKNVVGALGLILGLMALTGICLWWPVRRQYRLRSLLPASASRANLIRLHRDLGIVAAAFVLLFGLTGAGVVFGDATRALFLTLLSPSAEPVSSPKATASAPATAPDAALLERAQAALPDGQLMSWSPPVAGSAVHYFRFRVPGEVHPYGRSTVHADANSGEILQSQDATRAPRGIRAVNWLYPLHAVSVGGWAYRLAGVFAALALAVMSLSGLWSFVQWLRRRRPR
jgi:uncharacterized iron-regulated membrane protein